MIDLQHHHNNCTTPPHMGVEPSVWDPPPCEEGVVQLLWWRCVGIKSLLLNIVKRTK